jgi:lysophospholipase L1-like esterase
MGLGDSLGEGDQSGNAFELSQPNGYLPLIALQAGVPFNLPLIKSDARGFVGALGGHRSRIDPTSVPADIAVSGATISDVLTTRASPNPTREVDLVLPPYYGLSQIEIVERVKPKSVFLWIGSNDLINYILDWQHLDSAQVTPLPTFTAQFNELIKRLKTAGVATVVGNIPDLTQIAFLLNNDDLTRLTGTNYNLPAGYYTTAATMVMLKLGVFDGSILQNPGYVLTPARISQIKSNIKNYNDVITQAAQSAKFPLANAAGVIDDFANSPVVIGGITLTNRFNGGAFSLDGIHPSNTAYAVLANTFISAANHGLGTQIPTIDINTLINILKVDPFVDKNGNGVVPGRPRTGLVETLMPILGLSGDQRDSQPATVMSSARPADVRAFMSEYYRLTGRNPNASWTKADVINAVDEMFRLR